MEIPWKPKGNFWNIPGKSFKNVMGKPLWLDGDPLEILSKSKGNPVTNLREIPLESNGNPSEI